MVMLLFYTIPIQIRTIFQALEDYAFSSDFGELLKAQNLLIIKLRGMLMIRLIRGAMYLETPS